MTGRSQPRPPPAHQRLLNSPATPSPRSLAETSLLQIDAPLERTPSHVLHGDVVAGLLSCDDALMLNPLHPAALSDEALLRQCEVGFGRSSGPGGQHRNKVETAVTILHKPTGIAAQAGERRRQIENRHAALRRLRLKLAMDLRRDVHPSRYQPSELWESRRQGDKMSVNPKHRDYPGLLAEALDVIWARGFDVAGAAGVLGVTMSQLARLVRHDRHAFAMVNEGRVIRGLPAMK